MRAKWPIFAMFVVLGVGYLGYPYLTLYRLDIAMRHNDAGTLRSLVDWYSVREGLKEDICDMVLDTPAAAPRADDELPPFGASFVRGMTANVVDQKVTPETLVSMTQTQVVEPHPTAHLSWAFFDGPTQFSVVVHTSESVEPVRVMMELHGMSWQVRRVWLPNDILEHAGSGDERRVSLLAP
jgi:hypothetical protein